MIQTNTAHSMYNTLIPSAAVIVSLIIGLTTKPKGLMVQIIQALAAGILLACIAGELLPELNFSQNPVPLSLAVISGLALMLALSQVNPGCCSTKTNTTPLLPFVTGFSIEFAINGLVIVLAVAASQLASIVTAVSLSICCFVCGLTVTTRFIHTGYTTKRTSTSIVAMSLLFPLGGLFGLFSLQHLSEFWNNEIIAFGMAILLYIATADLLVDGFKGTSIFPKISLYFGFLLIIIVKSLAHT